jgi:hypothetical protein
LCSIHSNNLFIDFFPPNCSPFFIPRQFKKIFNNQKSYQCLLAGITQHSLREVFCINKYGGSLFLLFMAAACCCGCIGGDSIFSGGHYQTFGPGISDEPGTGVTLDEALVDLSVSQSEGMISFRNQSFLAVRGIQMTGDGRALSWALFAQPENENRTVVLIYTERGWSEYEWSLTIPYVPFDPVEILAPEELFRIHDNRIAGYFSAPDAVVDIFLSNGTYVTTVSGQDIYESFRFDAVTGEWLQ